MIADSFAVFILTHGRPNNVITYRTLIKGGYTGDVYIIVDNEDSTIDEYKKNFGDKVIVFDKAAIAETTDAGDNFSRRDTVLYARNACWDIARDLGVEYFLQLDDDYIKFRYSFDDYLRYRTGFYVTKLDRLFNIILDFFKAIPAKTIATAQNGDYIGGGNSSCMSRIWLKRKAMNSFFCSVNRPFEFTGRMNDDVNTYVINGNRGDLIFTFFAIAVNQRDTQSQAGGLTDMYLEYGTYIKSFYTVMLAPSCVKVSEMGEKHSRLHHRINWNNAVPKIVHERYCKRLTPERTSHE